MKSNDDMKRVEREIDHLETHADVAEGTARAALRADELQQRLSDAAARGDKVLVKQLSTEIDRAWETAHERAQQVTQQRLESKFEQHLPRGEIVAQCAEGNWPPSEAHRSAANA